MPARVDHATFVASDPSRSFAFYDAAFGALGLSRRAEFGDEEEDDPAVEVAWWGGDDGTALLWVVSGGAPTVNAHLRVIADSRTDVDAFHAAAVGAGGASRGRPRRWTIFRTGEYRAAVADPDGNVIEVVAGE